jgi:hypothetical protein
MLGMITHNRADKKPDKRGDPARRCTPGIKKRSRPLGARLGSRSDPARRCTPGIKKKEKSKTSSLEILLFSFLCCYFSLVLSV